MGRVRHIVPFFPNLFGTCVYAARRRQSRLAFGEGSPREELQHPHSLCNALAFLAERTCCVVTKAAYPIAERTVVLATEYAFPLWLLGADVTRLGKLQSRECRRGPS